MTVNHEYDLDLAKVRIERAQELLEEAKNLYDAEAYKSAITGHSMR